MKLFLTNQIRQYDAYTIKQEPISSLDLMERAAQQLCDTILNRYSSNNDFTIVCGRGNNGGDGLAIARLLSYFPMKIEVILIDDGKPLSEDAQTNLDRLPQRVDFVLLSDAKNLTIRKDSVVIDCIFGTGLRRLPEGIFADVILFINELANTVVAIDLPSGLMGDEIPPPKEKYPIIRADVTLTIQQPKLSFFFAEAEQFVGDWEVVDIGLSKEFYQQTPALYHTIDLDLIQSFYRKRKKFSHKGTFGHSLVIAGSEGKVGAALLASRACLKSGCGLVTACISKEYHSIFHAQTPELMLLYNVPMTAYNEYDALGIGPGMGTEATAKAMLHYVLEVYKKPLVLDADALNIIALEKELLAQLPPYSILTPHPKEFDRLFGASSTSYERFQKQQKLAQQYHIILILKGAYTSVALPDGSVYFNTTGNPGMATAGSGDVLTGIITGLVAQNYTPQEAALMGVYLHGLAGDIALEQESQESLLASDIIENLGMAFRRIQ